MRYWEMDVAETAAAMAAPKEGVKTHCFAPSDQQGTEGQRNRVMTCISTSVADRSAADHCTPERRSSDLPVVTERLRASREQALSMRKRRQHRRPPAQEADPAQRPDGRRRLGDLGTGPSGWMPRWLRHALTALPIAAMVAGIAFIGVQRMPAPPWKWPSSTPSC
jgi:hypothetical protein